MKHLKQKTVALTLLLAILVPVAAQTAQGPLALSIEQAKAFALTNNKPIQMSLLDVEIAKKKVTETTAIGLPQVSLAGNYQHIFKVPNFGFGTTGFTQSPLTFDNGTAPAGFSQWTPEGMGGINQYYYAGASMPIMEQDNATFDLKVSQLIFSGEYIVGLQASKVYKTISEQSLKKNQIDIGANVETTYYTVLILGESLNTVKQNIVVTEKTLAEMQAMEKSGFIENTDVDQIQINLTYLNNLALSMQGQQQNALNLLKYQLGLDLTQPLTLTDSLPPIIDNLSDNQDALFTVTDNIDYQMVENQVEMQKLNLKLEKSAYLPTLAAFYQHEELAKQPALNFTPKDILGISLSLPIFSSGERSSKVKQANLSLKKAELNKLQVADGLTLQFERQKLNCYTAYTTFLNQKQNADLTFKIFNKTTVKMKEGISTSLELTQAQTQYLSAMSNYYTSVLNVLTARTELQVLMSK
jgi:outer membrane protein TolC